MSHEVASSFSVFEMLPHQRLRPQRRIAHDPPFLVRSKVDPDLEERSHQVIHRLRTVSNRRAIQ